MNLQHIPDKVAKRLSHYAFKSFGIPCGVGVAVTQLLPL